MSLNLQIETIKHLGAINYCVQLQRNSTSMTQLLLKEG